MRSPTLIYDLSIYTALDSHLTVIRNFLDIFFLRKYTLKRINSKNLLEKDDRKLCKTRFADSSSLLSNMLRDITADHPITKAFIEEAYFTMKSSLL